jgi:hypothetical protein
MGSINYRKLWSSSSFLNTSKLKMIEDYLLYKTLVNVFISHMSWFPQNVWEILLKHG